MTIKQRYQAVMTSPNRQDTGEVVSERTNLLSGSNNGSKLLSFEESLRLLPWQSDNEYVTSGYRNQLGSIKTCIWSAVSCKSIVRIR
jgi:hypothetical protein